MTINNLFRHGVEVLKSAQKDDAEFDARCLMEHVLDIGTTEFFLSRANETDDSVKEHYLELINRRVNGEPLQYIIGKWEFCGNEFYVGEGVLIPRPETEMLVRFASDFLKVKKNPVIVDFCSGSGCIAVSVAKIIPDARVYAVEKYPQAFSFLQKNIALNNVENIKPINGDLFDKNALGALKPDLILSNPPYIRSGDIKALECEVLKEPLTALDGGVDGYDFYRFLSEFWFKEILKVGGAMMLECAEDQGDAIAEMLSVAGGKASVFNDLNGLQRVVTAYK